MAAIYTPRHLRRKGRSSGGPKDPSKKMAFARAAAWSKRFINQGYNALQSPKLANAYAEWGDAANKGNLRRNSKGG